MEWKDRFSDEERQSIVTAGKNYIFSSKGGRALDYLINTRKLSKEVIEEFNIGYCPVSANHQLRGRFITPIYNENKDLVTISTRHYDKNNSFRFWHEVFNKGSFVYSLNIAKDFILSKNKVIIVEGELDVASMHTYGFKATVGICGSALTLFQIALLSQYASFFFFLFDGDEPGRKAYQKAIKLYNIHNLLSYDIHFIPIFLPQGYDPDDFLKEFGKEEMKKKLLDAQEEYQFLK